MKQRWRNFSQWFNERSARERAILAGSMTVLLVFVCINIVQPYWQHYQTKTARLAKLEQSIEKQRQTQARYQQRLSLDPDDAIKQELANLVVKSDALDKEIKANNIIPAHAMAGLLEQILSLAKKVTVTSVESLKPVAIQANETTILYSHGVKLNLSGRFFAISRFFKEVEALPDKLYWRNLDYQVIQYPKAAVSVEFYTLSVNKEFMSVKS